MLSSRELARLKPSVSEQQIRQRWRGALLWVLRAMLIVLLFLVLKTALIWPMRDIDQALDSCTSGDPMQARLCMRREIEVRRIPIEQARIDVLAFIVLTFITFGVALWIRFDLRRQLAETCVSASRCSTRCRCRSRCALRTACSCA